MDGNILKISSRLINDRIKFTSEADNKPQIVTDYIPPLGDGKDYMPLELFLISFSTCVSGTVASLLRKMRKTVSDLKVDVEGIMRKEHPLSFEKIIISFELLSPDAQQEDIEKAINLSHEKYCPVWAMIKNNVEVVTEYRIVR